MGIADARLYLAKQKGRNRICASDKSSRGERLMDTDMVCPKLDEAITMIKHGNIFRLIPHLQELAEQILPLLELFETEGQMNPPLDMDAVRRSLASLTEE